MSWRFYETLSVQPDFTNPPEMGLVDSGMTLIEFGSASAWGAWHGDTPLAFRFAFRLETAAENRTFREFMNRMGGKSVSFFLPSWVPDYELTADGVIGETALRIKAAGLSTIEDNRPDTPGRQIFVVLPSGEFQTFGITQATLDGDDEVLTLDFPITNTIDASVAMVGRLYLVRLSDDRIEYTFDKPGACFTDMAMISARATRRLNDQQLLTGELLHNLKAFNDVISTDENPLMDEFLHPSAIGPDTYGYSQADNFYREWYGVLNGTTFSMTGGTTGTTIASDLYDSSFESTHITFGFDAGGKEAVAWVTERNLIRMGWKNGASNTHLNFAGYSPVMFQTWAIDGTVSAGDADLIVFYLKPGYSGIFARFIRESFATEHLVAGSPSAPIYLQMARRFEGRIEVVGMDSGHRRSRWRTGGYLTPPEVQNVLMTPGRTMSGEYRAITIHVDLSDSASLGHTGMTGEFRSIRTTADTPSENWTRSAHGGQMTGAYTSVRILAEASETGTKTTLSSGLTGEYKLITQKAATEDGTNSKHGSMTGTYS